MLTTYRNQLRNYKSIFFDQLDKDLQVWFVLSLLIVFFFINKKQFDWFKKFVKFRIHSFGVGCWIWGAK